MNYRISLTGLLKAVLLTLGVGVTMSGCAQVSRSGTDAWKEEVLLHDGQKVIVERSQTYGGRREIGQSPPVREHSISFIVPGSGTSITWTSEYGEDLGRTNFKLAALHILKNTAYLVAVPNLCLAYNKWGRPNPPYVLFKYQDNEWKRIPLNELPSEFKDINLVINNLGEAAILTAQPVVAADLVKRLNGELRQPEYKTILREPLPNQTIHAMCEERILYKGAWILPNDPIARKFIDSQKK